jgi:hypothetical protein
MTVDADVGGLKIRVSVVQFHPWPPFQIIDCGPANLANEEKHMPGFSAKLRQTAAAGASFAQQAI